MNQFLNFSLVEKTLFGTEKLIVPDKLKDNVKGMLFIS
jgi:hypothetical protein